MLRGTWQRRKPGTRLRVTVRFRRRAASVVCGVSRIEPAAAIAENAEVPDPHLLQRKLQSGSQHAETVLDAALEVDRRCFLEIFRGTGNLADAKPEINTLRQHLVVKHEVVGILEQRQTGKHIATEGAVAAVVFRQLHPQEEVFEGSQKAVGNILP